MAKNDDHSLSDRFGRGRANPQKGIGAYTHSRTLTGTNPSKDDIADGKVDRSDSPNKKPYGSMYYGKVGK